MGEKTLNEDIELWTISEIARATKLSRDTVRDAMNLYENSNGYFGLAFVQIDNGSRRFARKEQVRNWFERLERRSARR